MPRPQLGYQNLSIWFPWEHTQNTAGPFRSEPGLHDSHKVMLQFTTVMKIPFYNENASCVERKKAFALNSSLQFVSEFITTAAHFCPAPALSSDPLVHSVFLPHRVLLSLRLSAFVLTICILQLHKFPSSVVRGRTADSCCHLKHPNPVQSQRLWACKHPRCT